MFITICLVFYLKQRVAERWEKGGSIQNASIKLGVSRGNYTNDWERHWDLRNGILDVTKQDHLK